MITVFEIVKKNETFPEFFLILNHFRELSQITTTPEKTGAKKKKHFPLQKCPPPFPNSLLSSISHFRRVDRNHDSSESGHPARKKRENGSVSRSHLSRARHATSVCACAYPSLSLSAEVHLSEGSNCGSPRERGDSCRLDADHAPRAHLRALRRVRRAFAGHDECLLFVYFYDCLI
ncbi:hypothetical protein CEXT_157571 [Caerostris extrusa]|uniref:Uncharacterized protein n=1 Tax=Caerostris extrusa TaxID=172846 RepID=A0AAV4P9Y8_CAEEX|nr:hypothetical protein CEXT_157571 [Caerostris extrusa]